MTIDLLDRLDGEALEALMDVRQWLDRSDNPRDRELMRLGYSACRAEVQRLLQEASLSTLQAEDRTVPDAS